MTSAGSVDSPRVHRLLSVVGGRYSKDLGIDVDGGAEEVERWFVAATLFGNRISASIAERTFLVLDGVELTRLARLRKVSWEQLVELLDEGGYARYDFRTASRLHSICDLVAERFGGCLGEIGRRYLTYPAVHDALDGLPGWGPVTIDLFLREMRGVWPGAEPPLDRRAERAAHHLGLRGFGEEAGPATDLKADPLTALAALCSATGTDLRDLESGLVKLALAHHNRMDRCPGGDSCTILESGPAALGPRPVGAGPPDQPRPAVARPVVAGGSGT